MRSGHIRRHESRCRLPPLRCDSTGPQYANATEIPSGIIEWTQLRFAKRVDVVPIGLVVPLPVSRGEPGKPQVTAIWPIIVRSDLSGLELWRRTQVSNEEVK